MRRARAYASLWALVFAGTWAVGCGSDPSSPAQGAAGEAGSGDEAGQATSAGQPSASAGSSQGGAAAGEAGAGHDAASGRGGDAAGGATGGAGGAASADHGELLFDSPGDGATAKGGLFLGQSGLVWLYTSGGKSVIATGPTSGGERVDLVSSADEISVFDVRSTIAYQAAGKLFVHPLSATPSTPVELTGAPSCVALTSASGNVYCRSTTGTIVRWPETGGVGTVIATGVPPGADLVADAAPVNPSLKKLFFCEDQGIISSIPLGGFGGGAITAPQYQQIDKQEASPQGLHVGVPGDDVLYWINLPTTAAARVRGSAKTTPPVTSAGPALEHTRVFTPYSWSAGAIIAVENADESAVLAFVRFGQSFITPHYESVAGVVALTAESGRYYWLDRSARVFGGAPK